VNETEERVRVVDVVVDPRSGGIDSLWTYKVEGPAARGDAFFVPLGPRAVIGFAVNVYEATEKELGFPLKQLKPVLDRIQGLGLPEELMSLVTFVAEQYLCPLSLALSAAAPPGVRDRIVTAWKLTGAETHLNLTPLQQEIVKMMQEKDDVLIERPGKKLPPPTVRALKLLRGKGLVEQRLQLQPFEERRERPELLRLSSDTEKIERFLTKEGKKKPAQSLTIMRLQTGEPAPLTGAEIKALSGVTDTTLRIMLESGLLEKVEQNSLIPKTPPTPNEAQKTAIDAIVGAIKSRKHERFLLHGVTGSGKTEVYVRAASEALQAGRQILYLVPEIALATQAITLLRERFGSNVSLIHSELSARERLETWVRIKDGSSPIVLGARSALFAPLSNLGLIIVDEEHETSYKQESAPRYHAKRLALHLGEVHNAAVVLGSATPSIETFYETETDSLRLLTLPIRAAAATMPSVEIVDLTEGYRAGHPAILSPTLHEQLTETLEKGHQAILFLNRRAYAPFLICRDCGHQFQCPRCAVSLAFSRTDKRLRCHHCGYNVYPPDHCPKCRGHRLNPFGIGTEKVEEAAIELFPNYRTARMDRDVARKKGAVEEILAKFRSGDINILVGTQMVAKGLDFPNVTLVGVIAADMSLNVPDFRSSERTFQLLAQVAGRAGRGKEPGNVVIQTFNPGHVAVASAQTHDYSTFYKAILEERSEAFYPPFARLINVILSGEDSEAVRIASEEVGELLQDLPDALVLGPATCPIERIQGRWRRHLLIKLPPDSEVSQLGAMLAQFQSKKVMVVADVDPYSLS
jgi:primosomal protein N' (replication factor Y)